MTIHDISHHGRMIDKALLFIIEYIRKRPHLHFIFETFGKRDIDRIYEGHGNFTEVRGWYFFGNWIPYDEDGYHIRFPDLDPSQLLKHMSKRQIDRAYINYMAIIIGLCFVAIIVSIINRAEWLQTWMGF